MSARIIVGVAVGIALLAYGAIVRPLEKRIAERYQTLTEQRRAFSDDAALQERLAQADRERARLAATLATYRLDAEPATLVARFLEAAATAALRHGTTIHALDAQPAASHALDASSFDELPLRLTIRGSYRALLGTLREIIAAPIANRLNVEALTPDEGTVERPLMLLAVVRVRLLRLPEAARVRARPR